MPHLSCFSGEGWVAKRIDDHLGSLSVQTDKNGNVIGTTNLSPYGQAVISMDLTRAVAMKNRLAVELAVNETSEKKTQQVEQKAAVDFNAATIKYLQSRLLARDRRPTCRCRQAGRWQLHAMDAATHRILWTHRTNRAVRYMEDWQTVNTLPTESGVYYENAGLLAKVAR